jgi:hypothetical protein
MLPAVRVHLWGVVVTLLVLVGALPAAADALSAKVDATRGSALPIDAGLDAVAQASAQRQADANALGHTSLAGLPCSAAGEVVGSGPSVDAIWTGFRSSPSHWSLIIRSGWTAMGTGIAQAANGNLYVSIVFCTMTGPVAQPPPPPPPPSPPPASAPLPSVRGTSPRPAPAPTFAAVIGGWIDSMHDVAVTAFGAMPPPVSPEADLSAFEPMVV